MRVEAEKEADRTQETGTSAQERNRDNPWDEGVGTAQDETVLQTQMAASPAQSTLEGCKPCFFKKMQLIECLLHLNVLRDELNNGEKFRVESMINAKGIYANKNSTL